MQQPTQKRLQKLLADAGIGSRRRIENLIANKQIKINGKVAELGSKASSKDRISIADIDIQLPKQPNHKALFYHKPLGTIVSRSDPQSRPTVFDNLPQLQNSRWISVGRLDINTSGLLLFCSDGQLAHRLMHPATEIERTYLVRIRGTVSATTIEHLLNGVRLDDGEACFKQLSRHNNRRGWYKVVVAEGRNRLIRRLWASQGLLVDKLIRVGFGRFELTDNLARGAYRIATKSELDCLYKMAGLSLS
ncbi:MAG: rRNA pseudouridine synthase [Chromatiales bacterium]|nr:rRNA pseudouridine synthase [Chromatiales bacterium]